MPRFHRQLVALVAMALFATVPLATFSSSAQASDGVARPLKIVLLGDSYSAGNGARDANGDRDYYGPKDCYRSHSNWAEQYVATLRDSGYNVTFINRACSGAVTDNLINDRRMDTTLGHLGVVSTPTSAEAAQAAVESADPCNQHAYPDEEYWTYSVFGYSTNVISYYCTRFLKAQVDAIGPDTDLVLFTIGGNDIEFSNIVKQCFVIGIRDPGDCRDAVTSARELLPTVKDRVVNIIDAMRDHGLRDDARVVLGGYPLLAQDNGYDLTSWFGLGGDNYQVADEVRLLGKQGDAMQDQIVAEANASHPGQVIHLTGVPDLFEGHEPDGSATSRNPDRWLWEFETKVQMEWYHPNPTGHYEYAQLLAHGGTYGAAGSSTGAQGDIDVVMVLDTTGSMGSSIDAVKQYATSLVDQVSAASKSARFALVTYRDHPSWTGWSGDYPSRVEQGFTSDAATVKDALNTVTVAGGGDYPESMYSGLMSAIGLPWRPGVKKVVVVLADAPAHDPEPVTGYTADDVIAASLAVDPAEVYLVNTGGADSAPVMRVVNGTDGKVIEAYSASDVPGAIMDALEVALAKPYAWVDGPYVARVGRSVPLDASGSYATEGSLASYEWDFDGDGTYDATTSTPLTSHTWSQSVTGHLAVRVTDSSGRSSVTTTHLAVTDDGDETPTAKDNCPAIDNQGQEDYDGDGVGDMCDDSPGWPTSDKEGVTEGDAPMWPFDGFRAPVNDAPTVNVVNAGRSIPVKFGLGDDRGLDIFAAPPSSRQIACSDTESTDPVEVTADSNSGLHYDQGTATYNYVWQTAQSWDGTCRELTLALKDGSTHRAVFEFH